MTSARADDLRRLLAREFRRHVVEEYVPRIQRCTELLSTEQCWQRPGPYGNSIGVLLRHLEGNVRQWILVGFGGDPDRRDRPAEFAATAADSATIEELVAALDRTARAAATIIDRLTVAEMTETRTFQGQFEETGVGAVVHVLEHFSGHAGQIYAATKQMLGIDLKFWDL